MNYQLYPEYANMPEKFSFYNPAMPQTRCDYYNNYNQSNPHFYDNYTDLHGQNPYIAPNSGQEIYRTNPAYPMQAIPPMDRQYPPPIYPPQSTHPLPYPPLSN